MKLIFLFCIFLSSCTFKYNENDFLKKSKDELPMVFDTDYGQFELLNVISIKFSENEQRIFLDLDAKFRNSKFDALSVSGKPVLKGKKLYLSELRAEKIEFILNVTAISDFILNKFISELEVLEITNFEKKLLKSFYIKDDGINLKINIF